MNKAHERGKTVLGIDPGLLGGIGWMNSEDCGATPMPVTAKEINVAALRSFLLRVAPDAIVIEKASTRPKQSAQSGLTTGINYGIVLGIIKTLQIPVYEVSSQTWKKKMGLSKEKSASESTKDRKDRSRALASSHFPQVDLRATDRCKTIHDGMAEALLLAEYGRMFLAL